MPRCKRCGRKLTDPISIQREYGPECIEAINLELDLTEQARMGGVPGYKCQDCEQVTPVECFHWGQCPACYYGITTLQAQDVEPFAEVR